MRVCIATFGADVIRPKNNTSKRLVETAAIDSISQYNFGNVATIRGLMQASLLPGAKSTRIAKMRDRRRRIKVEKAKSEKFKRRRYYLRLKNIQEEDTRKKVKVSLMDLGNFNVSRPFQCNKLQCFGFYTISENLVFACGDANILSSVRDRGMNLFYFIQ